MLAVHHGEALVNHHIEKECIESMREVFTSIVGVQDLDALREMMRGQTSIQGFLPELRRFQDDFRPESEGGCWMG